ncbi:bifunctional phosphoserine phosphatase/homoserine phosphotransferase ThrH [Terasakiella pusilla]|uniref:bifunctional phosphoserine phosphatase/homoserine phosphotransferase ThrH n=1 Tax=Terasakiella pusilla TaxID=64973 RepID=UPI003AA7F6F5
MEIVCLDLEGVLVPEIWIAFAEKTGIEALKRTTRDEPDYDALMQYRLDLLRENNLKMSDIQDVISQMAPLEGARDFLGQLREDFQVVILSDTFYEFAKPLMRQLDLPTLFCHRLLVDETDAVVGYQLRLADHKRKAVEAFAQLNFYTIAAGDSYNDTSMLSRADVGGGI